MSVTTTLEDTFIHPLFHSYFYSPRMKRAYSFSAHKVWFYEVDDEGFGSFRLNEFDFDHQTLSSYWALMWFLIALVLLCCCCCCIFHIKKKRDKTRRNQERFGGMTAEQEMMTQV